MSKKIEEPYWFRHDVNAKDDPKCLILIDELGLEGYGIYWVLIEILRAQADYRYPLKLIPSLARKYATTSPKMQTVIMNYNLFEIENDEFFLSFSLVRRMKKYDETVEQLRQNALKGVKKRKEEAEKQEQTLSLIYSCEQMLGKCSADAEREEKSREENNYDFIKEKTVEKSQNKNTPSPLLKNSRPDQIFETEDAIISIYNRHKTTVRG